MFVLVLIGASFTGCLDDDTEICDMETIIQDGEYAYCSGVLKTDDVTVWWDFEYKDGTSNVDIYFMDDINFQSYRDGDPFVYISQLSREDVKSTSIGKTTISLEDGETYYLIIDHTSAGEAQPDWGDDVWFRVVLNIERA